MQRISISLDDFPLSKITFTDITLPRANGETLLSLAQKEKNQQYLDYFYQLALGFFKKDRTGEIDPEATYDDNPVTITAEDLDNAATLEEKNSKISQTTLTRHNILWYAIQLFQSDKNLRSLMAAGCKADTVFYTNGVAMSAFFTALKIENTVATHVLNSKNKNLVHTPNEDNLLPAHWAAKQGKLTSLKYLNIINKDLIRESAHHTDRTCLHLAIQAKQHETARWLLEVYASAKYARDASGYTPAHYLVTNDDDHELLLNALIAMDAKHVVSGEQATHPNKSPLQLAIELGKMSVLQRLFLLNKNLFQPFATGAAGNCLHLAAEKKQPAAARWLVEKFTAMKNEADIYGYTPLHYAVLNDDEIMTDILCRAGANINLKSNVRAKFSNKSPLQIAIEHGKKNLIGMLMPAHGYSVAHYAVIQQDKALLSSALTHKCGCTEPSAATTQHPNMTPLQLAAILGDSEIVRMMLQSNIHPTEQHPITDASRLSPEMQTALGLIAYIPMRKEEEAKTSYLTQLSHFAGAAYSETDKIAAADKLLQYLINDISNPISLLSDRERDILCNGRLNGITEVLMKKYEESLQVKASAQNN